METPEISKTNFIMTQFHLKYHPSRIWKEDEIKRWNALSIELESILKESKPEDYDAKIKEFLKEKLVPLAAEVGCRYIEENKISEGLENLKYILFDDPKRPVELAILNEDVISITDSPKKAEASKE